MKKEKGKNRSYFFGSLIIFVLIIGVISFGISYSRQKMDLKALEQVNEEQIEIATEQREIYDIQRFFNQVDDVFLESYYGPSDIIELNENERENVASLFINQDINYIMSSSNKEISYLYAVHIKDKNIKIKVNESYLLIENQNEIQLFSVENEGLKDLNTKLEEIYMAKYNSQDVFHKAQSITVFSRDEKMEWTLDSKEIRNLEDRMILISPISNDEIIGIPRMYPDYLINIKADEKDYSINLINENILAIDFSDSMIYYKYDSGLLEYIKKEFPIKMNYEPTEFKYLLQSTKVVVDAENDNFDIEDESFYPIEIPRYIIAAEKIPLEKLREGEELIFTMFFTIKNQVVEVKIYENQIQFSGQVYYSKNIGESIKSMLNV